MRVLVVEDNPEDVAVIERLAAMSPTPVDLIIASDGEHAIDVLLRRRNGAAPELVLLDIGLPAMDGLSVLQRIRALGLRDIPVILLTGSQDEHHLRQALRMKAHSYLLKPLQRKDFVWIVDSLRNYRRLATLDQRMNGQGGQ